jgi:hypothetical protein
MLPVMTVPFFMKAIAIAFVSGFVTCLIVIFLILNVAQRRAKKRKLTETFR